MLNSTLHIIIICQILFCIYLRIKVFLEIKHIFCVLSVYIKLHTAWNKWLICPSLIIIKNMCILMTGWITFKFEFIDKLDIQKYFWWVLMRSKISCECTFKVVLPRHFWTQFLLLIKEPVPGSRLIQDPFIFGLK